MTRPRRFLCVCQGGNVRSAALKHILNYGFQQEALSCSAEKNSPETLRLLCDWADYVVLMSPEMLRWWPEGLARDKLCLVDVGPDSYGSPFHPGLCAFLTEVVATWAAREWDVFGPRPENVPTDTAH